tara:strand:+ start:18802 stop:22284 length:3483 start_codon:yes stop_codon:yes gene_type:complete
LPKKNYIIKDFSGGMNLQKHTSYLDDSESVLLQNLRADKGGKLRAGFETSTVGAALFNNKFIPAYGSVYPKSDYFWYDDSSRTWDFSSASHVVTSGNASGTSIVATQNEGIHFAAGSATWGDAYTKLHYKSDWKSGSWYRIQMVFAVSSGTCVAWNGEIELAISSDAPNGAGWISKYHMEPKSYVGNRGGIYVKGNASGTLTNFSAACTSVTQKRVIVDTLIKTPPKLCGDTNSGYLYILGHPNGVTAVGMPTWTLINIDYQQLPWNKDLTSEYGNMNDSNGNFFHCESDLDKLQPGGASSKTVGSMFSKSYDNSHNTTDSDITEGDDTSLINFFQSGELTRMSEGGFLRESEPKIFGPIIKANKHNLGGIGSTIRTVSSTETTGNDRYQAISHAQSRQFYFGCQDPNSILTSETLCGTSKLNRTLECYNNTTNRAVNLAAEEVSRGKVALFITKPSANGTDMKDGWRKVWKFGIAYKLNDGSSSYTNVQEGGTHCISGVDGKLIGFEIKGNSYDLTRTHGIETGKTVTMPGASADITNVDLTMKNGILTEVKQTGTPTVQNKEAFEIDGVQMGGSAAIDEAGFVYASNAHIDFEIDLSDISTYTQNPRFELAFKENIFPPSFASDIGGYLYANAIGDKLSSYLGGNANYRDPRITGFLIFMYSAEDLSQGEDVPWLPAMEVDLVSKQYKNHTYDKQWRDLKEHRTNSSDKGLDFTAYYTGDEFAHDGTYNSEEVPTTFGATYSTSLLYNSNEDTKVKWKCSTIVNGRSVIGNILKNGVSYNDRIMVSAPGTIDVFPEDYSYDAAQSDGQSIVALKSFADKLLIYKEKNFYIYNATNTNDIFIEGEYEYYGVLCPSSIVESDYGITWFAHNMGILHYDGQSVKNLSEKHLSLPDLGSDLTNITGTSTGVTSKDKPVLAFVPHEKLLLFIPDVQNANVNYSSGSFQTGNWTNNAWAYDFDTQDWTLMENFAYNSSAGHSFTNIVNNEDKGVLFLRNSADDGIYPSSGARALMQLNPSELITYSANKQLAFKTKEIDFGDVGLDKHVYRVIFKYRSAAAIGVDTNRGIKIQAVINGDYTSVKEFDSSLAATNRLNHLQNFDGATLHIEGKWLVQEMTPATPSEFKNIKTLAIVASHGSSNLVSSKFELDSISIVYRLKGVAT